MKDKKIVLPNPDVKREQCVKECDGCNKMFSSMEMRSSYGKLSEDEVDDVIGDVCIAYIKPKGRWINYSKEEGDVIKGTDGIKQLYHINPCNLASHIKHSPKKVVIKGRSGWKKGKSWG